MNLGNKGYEELRLEWGPRSMFGWLRRSKQQTANHTAPEPTISRANSEGAKTVMFFVLAMMQWVDEPEHQVEMDALGWHLLCTSMSDRVAKQQAGLDVIEIATSAASGLFSAEPDEVSDAVARMKENWARLQIQHPQLATRYKARVHALITDPAACAVVHLARLAAKPDDLKHLFRAIPPHLIAGAIESVTALRSAANGGGFFWR